MTILSYILVWAGTTATFFLGFVCGKPWLDKRLNKSKPPASQSQQQGVIAP